VCKKFKDANGKRDERRGGNGEKEVVVFIGLVEWNESHECLKRKHGKRVVLKVKKKMTHQLFCYNKLSRSGRPTLVIALMKIKIMFFI